ncbi:hypothetical protein SLEP1_g39448 [Rubroshorea leprosula]|uniref:Uncharacterized protein n=1 Tax=Rubroshorea leprosula TaxID=152421 RepID=A0AAV5L0F8_9ROSI|nr:hypothetical protein SLEP1_g39448 [Rubroshorea leprosula]
MSSEGTVSVVGSEVMPLDYGSMDEESSLSPSGSERMVEERRDQRVGEEDEDEIPSNILEAWMRVDGCYDPDLEMVSEVRGYVSELGSRESLRGLVGNCNLPHHVLIMPAGAKKTKQNNYKLNQDEVEEVEKLVREEEDVVDILYLTSPKAIEAAELYGPSSLSEAKMDEFVSAAEGLRIPKKPRKKSKTSTAVDKGVLEKERLPSTSARSGREEAEVRGPGRGKALIPPRSYEKSLFEAANTTGAKHFLNSTLPEVDKMRARDEAVSRLGATVVRHALESASWTNALVQEYAESVRDRASLQRQCEQLQKEREELQKEREELQKEKEEWEREKREMQRRLDEVLPLVTELQNDNNVLSTKLALEERKRKICEEKLEAQDKYIDNMRKGVAELKKNVNLLVHNGMKEHIGNFLDSSTFENILNLYRLPTAILAFTDCRKKVKAQYLEVDVTTVTFGEQEERVEEDGESLSADFRPLIKLRWEHDAEGRMIFPPAFDAELVVVGEEGEEEEEVRGAEAEVQADPPEVQPFEVHPVSSDDVQQLDLPGAEVPPLPANDEPLQPPLPAEEQPPPPAE